MAKAASRGKIANKINSKKNKGKKDQAVLGKAQKNKIGAKPAHTGKSGNNVLNRGALVKKTKELGDEIFYLQNEMNIGLTLRFS